MTSAVLSRALAVQNKCENLEELILITPFGLVDLGPAVAFFKSLMHDNSQTLAIGHAVKLETCAISGGHLTRLFVSLTYP